MKSNISALMDGELEGHEAQGALEALRTDAEERETWRTYHLIGDAMRGARLTSEGFTARVSARIEAEPTVLAPKGRNARPLMEQRRWQVLSAAASVAAVGFVSMAFFSQDPSSPTAPVAAVGAPAAETVQVAPPDAANEYLLAHQVYSPRNSLQGVAPYVRTVSSDSRGLRQR
jgi:sigma-E factor negative regulatory protein RseA